MKEHDDGHCFPELSDHAVLNVCKLLHDVYALKQNTVLTEQEKNDRLDAALQEALEQDPNSILQCINFFQVPELISQVPELISALINFTPVNELLHELLNADFLTNFDGNLSNYPLLQDLAFREKLTKEIKCKAIQLYPTIANPHFISSNDGITPTEYIQTHPNYNYKYLNVKTIFQCSVTSNDNTTHFDSNDHTIEVYQHQTNGYWIKTQTLLGHKDKITSIYLSDDGNTLFSASSDQTIKIWDRLPNNTWNPTPKTLNNQYASWVTCRTHPHNKFMLFSVGNQSNSVIKIWQCKQDGNWILTQKFPTNTLHAYNLVFSHDGKTLFAEGGSYCDNSIEVYYRQPSGSWNAIQTIPNVKYSSTIKDIIFTTSNDDAFLFVISDHNTLEVYLHQPDGSYQHLQTLPEPHITSVYSTDLSPTAFLSCSDNNSTTLKKWQLATDLDSMSLEEMLMFLKNRLFPNKHS
jgi:WD40 repeat protein